MSTETRQPRYGGMFGFYPDNPTLIKQFIDGVDKLPAEQYEAKGLFLPHAGYLYSGKTMYRSLKAVKHFPENIIIIGPNHTGIGDEVSIMSKGSWMIMGQTIPILSNIADDLIQNSDYISDNPFAHQKEHSIEVILPLLLSIHPKFSLIPIIMRNYHPRIVDDVSNSIMKSVQSVKNNVMVIASSDMSHYISQQEAKQKDSFAFKAIQSMDSHGLLQTVHRHQISMCGSGPVAVAIQVSKYLGATNATLIDYTDSSEETKDTSEVVAYAGFIFH